MDEPGAPSSSSPQWLSLAEAFKSSYRIERELGRGAMGVVLLAEHLALRRQVAVKLLHLLDNPVVLARFLREEKLLARLEHPHVVRVFEGGEVSGYPYLVLEYLSGGTLRDRCPFGERLPFTSALPIAIQCLSGLAACHAIGAVHRDLKPANILFTADGVAKVADLGIAHLAEDQERLTKTGMTLGSPMYMAPEQIVGKPVQPCSDIYAMGVILYELLAGEPPLTGANPRELYLNHLSRTPQPIGARVEGLPEALQEIVHSMLAKRPGDRPADAEALSEDLTAVLEGRRPQHATARRARSPDGATRKATAARVAQSPAVSAPDPVKRRRARVVAALIAGFACIALVWLPTRRAPPAPVAVSPASPGPLPSASATGAKPRAPPPFLAWVRYRHHLRALRGPVAGSRAAVAALRREAPLDLGASAEAWAYWLDLGAWVAGDPAPDPPRSRRALGGMMDPVESELFRVAVRDQDRTTTAAWLSSALVQLVSRPDDGRPWLQLGEALHRDGDAPGAARVFRVALRRLTPGQFEGPGADPVVWAGLARALLCTPGYDLERDWIRYVPANMLGRHAWEGLSEVLASSARPRYVAILRAAAASSPADESATAMLAGAVEPPEAYRVLKDCVRRHPGSGALCGQLMVLALERGDVAEVRALLPRLPAQELWAGLPGYWPGPSARVPLPEAARAALATNSYLAANELGGSLEEADLPAAERAYDALRALVPWVSEGLLPLELVGLGSGREHVAAASARLLARDAAPASFLDATGPLSSAAGRPLLETRLAASGLSSSWRTRIHAVACSRRHDLVASLEALDAVHEPLPPAELAEVLTRPLILRAIGDPSARSDLAILDRLEAKWPAQAGGHAAERFRMAVRSGDLVAAVRLAQEARQTEPAVALWQVAPVWCALAKRDARAVAGAMDSCRMLVRAHRKHAWALRELRSLGAPAPAGWIR